MSNHEIATPGRRVAADLLDVGAVLLRPDTPFTWSSGMKAPIYCDNRVTLAHPAVRRHITDGFVGLAEQHAFTPDVVAGTATAGIPHAAWLAERLDAPMAYVRSKPKGHGRKNRIEGRVTVGQRILLVEDLISTGGSALAAAQALRAAGTELTAVLAIFTYGLDASRQAFAEAEVPLYPLTDFDTLLDVAQEKGRLTREALSALRDWQQAPNEWYGRQ